MWGWNRDLGAWNLCRNWNLPTTCSRLALRQSITFLGRVELGVLLAPEEGMTSLGTLQRMPQGLGQRAVAMKTACQVSRLFFGASPA